MTVLESADSANSAVVPDAVVPDVVPDVAPDVAHDVREPDAPALVAAVSESEII
jgi:hypothetical protein